MSKKSGFFRFQKLMADFAAEHIDPLASQLFAGEVIDQPPDESFKAIFFGFTDISATLDALKLTEALVGLSPPRSPKVKRDEYLKFLVGSYLQEVYILQQRLEAYGKKISRIYKKPDLPAAIKETVYTPLEQIILIRGAHVHQERYQDEHLNAVSTYTLFSQFKSEYADDVYQEYKVARGAWKRKIEQNNKATDSIVNQYFDLLFMNVCQQGKLVHPKLVGSAT